MFKRPKPRIKEIIQYFKTESENLAFVFIRIQLNLEGKAKKTEMYKKANNIEEI